MGEKQPTLAHVRRSRSKSCTMFESLTFIRRKGRYCPAKQTKLSNSLLAGVGYLELANAMDFPANVWNMIPVPKFAAVLMGIGGTAALAISMYAFKDAQLSRRNMVLLRDERQYLNELKTCSSQVEGTQRSQSAVSGQEKGICSTQLASKEKAREIQRAAACHLDVSFRETGMEIIDRIGMDSFMGFGAVLVAIGTYMAIGGANPNVYRASNLLSGYIGNSPSAFYGVVNAAWSIYVWRRAHRHRLAGAEKLKTEDVELLQKARVKTIKLHATLNGLTGLIAGAAGLVTAKMWWGYVVLIPCIFSAIYCNHIWRTKVGYERPSILQSPSVDPESIVEDIQFAAHAQKIFAERSSKAIDALVPDSESISCMMEFIVMNGFFEDFCIRLLKDTDLTMKLFGSAQPTLEIHSQSFLMADQPTTHRLLQVAEACIHDTGLARFQDRERFLLERLGCYMCIPGTMGDGEQEVSKDNNVRQVKSPQIDSEKVDSLPVDPTPGTFDQENFKPTHFKPIDSEADPSPKTDSLTPDTQPTTQASRLSS